MKQYHIDISEPAENDLGQTINYISKDLQEPVTSMNLLKTIEDAILVLETIPYRYSLAQDEYLLKQGIHILPVKNYLVFYVIDEGTDRVTIIRILYARRDWKNLLKLDL
jgi:toxin ParE1/3/4